MGEIVSVFDLLTPEERRRLRDDLAEIKRLRMLAEDSLGYWPTDPTVIREEGPT